MREVKLAYENVKVVDCLDLSPEGSAAWEAALKRYDERIDRVETKIAARLRDQLGTAKNANEMFRIFSRYNALFVRAHIRGAIREYQAQLIQRVKDDIEKLHQKFKVCTNYLRPLDTQYLCCGCALNGNNYIVQICLCMVGCRWALFRVALHACVCVCFFVCFCTDAVQQDHYSPDVCAV